MLIEKFIILSNEATTSRQLAVLWRKAMKKLGFDRLLFSLLMDHETIGRREGPVISANYPMAWLAQYTARRYAEIDPVREHMFSNKGAFTWDSLRHSAKLTPERIALLDMMTDVGLNSGIGIPMRGPNGELAAVMAASSSVLSPRRMEVLDYAEILSNHYYKLYLRLERKTDNCVIVRLTSREHEVLRFCAQGKSQKEVAIAIGISAHAVKFHMKGILSKLRVPTQEVAVIKARMIGLMPDTHRGGQLDGFDDNK